MSAKFKFEDYRLHMLESFRLRAHGDIEGEDLVLEKLDRIWLNLSAEDRACTDVYDFKADFSKFDSPETSLRAPLEKSLENHLPSLISSSSPKFTSSAGDFDCLSRPKFYISTVPYIGTVSKNLAVILVISNTEHAIKSRFLKGSRSPESIFSMNANLTLDRRNDISVTSVLGLGATS